MTHRRRGLSLLELVVVVAILAILLGLLLGAVQRVRLAGMRAVSENNLRQIILATHQLADMREGQIKSLAQASPPPKPVYVEQSIFTELLPWTSGGRTLPPNPTPQQVGEYVSPVVKCYMDPADPSIDALPVLSEARGKCSYSANMLAFDGSVLFPFTLPDGMSSTVAYCERYYLRRKGGDSYQCYFYIFPVVPPGDKPSGERRATFADRGWSDTVPVTDPATGKTMASDPGLTFQVRPRVEDADWRIPQTPHPGGLPVALFDGSVRTLSPSISEPVFWSLVSPNGGEVIGTDF